MNKRILSLLFIGLLSVGCGESDPTKENNGVKQNNGNPNNGGMTSNNGGMTSNNGGMTSNNGGTTSNNGTTAGMPEVCDDSNLTFYGQIASDGVHGGGVPGTTAFTADAGLDAIWLDTAANSSSEENEYVLPAPMLVDGAVVIGSWSGDAGNNIFWIEDGKRAMLVRLPQGTDLGATIKVGDALKFTAVKMRNFAGTPQFLEITDFEILSSGNTVVVLDRTGQDLAVEDVYRTVRIRGEISGGMGCPDPWICYDMKHGDKTITFRTRSEFDDPGDCITFVGSLGAFPGPLDSEFNAGKLQLTVENFDWSRGPFKE